MNVDGLSEKIQGTLLTKSNGREVESGLVCDLLSWVMAKGKSGAGLITVLTHLNVIAVATLLDLSAVIIPESIKVDQATLDKAEEEELTVISSPLSAYEICAIMSSSGIPA